MADFPAQSQDYNRVTISPGAVESIGTALLTAQGALTTSTAWPTANRAIFVPFLVRYPFTVVKMFCVNGATASGNVDVGIYDANGNRSVSAGSTAQAGTSAVQSFDVTDTLLLPGAYYMALALDNTTGTVQGIQSFALGVVSAFGLLSQASAFPLPSPATLVAAADAFVPSFGLTGRTVI